MARGGTFSRTVFWTRFNSSRLSALSPKPLSSSRPSFSRRAFTLSLRAERSRNYPLENLRQYAGFREWSQKNIYEMSTNLHLANLSWQKLHRHFSKKNRLRQMFYLFIYFVTKLLQYMAVSVADPDPDPLVRGTAPDTSIIKQK
jgi:hypothetical protein